MASVFLSHADEDRVEALTLKRALEASGRHRVFLSGDPETGIVAGATWERSVYDALGRAEAAVVLWSPRSAESKWCFAEITQARALGKPVLPVLWQTDDLPLPLSTVQATRHKGDWAAVAAELERGLTAAASDRGVPARSPRFSRRRAAALLLLAVAGGTAFALLHSREERPAFVTASSVPSATLSLDGVAVGPTPVAGHRVRPGEHELRLEHPRFHPYARRIRLEEGSTFEVDRPLRALDPADPEALREVARASGLEVSPVGTARAGGDPPAVLVVFPRGASREGPTQVTLRGDASVTECVLRLERLADRAAPTLLWESRVSPVSGDRTLAIPADVSAALGSGSRWRLSAVSPRGTELSAAQGAVLPTAERASLEARLARLGAGREADDLLPDLLRADLLVQSGLFVEAHALLERLAAALGPRREVARLMLVLLDRAGLAALPAFDEWLTRYEQGR